MPDISTTEGAVTDSTSRRPTTKVGAGAVKAAQVMVEAFNLATDASDTAILNGILDGLVSLVDHDAVGVYIVDPTGKKVRHSLMRGCAASHARARCYGTGTRSLSSSNQFWTRMIWGDATSSRVSPASLSSKNLCPSGDTS